MAATKGQGTAQGISDNEPLFKERIRGLRQQGHTEESALRAVMHDGEGSSKGQDVFKSSRAHAAPPGHRIKELSIRPAHTGIIVKHSYERIPGTGPVGSKDESASVNPNVSNHQLEREHAFSSTEEALNHINQHVGGLFHQGGSSTDDEDTQQEGGEWGRNRGGHGKEKY